MTMTAKEHIEAAIELTKDNPKAGAILDMAKTVVCGPLTKRAAVVQEVQPDPIDVHFSEVEIPPHGLYAVVAVAPQNVALFRGESFQATESERGATSIIFIGVGQRQQTPIAVGDKSGDFRGTSSLFFSEGVQGNGVLFDTWEARHYPMYAIVRNLTDKPVRWSAKATGKWVK